ncbi:hypothetical protein CPB86DRAFT_813355 [Serendipita vermifera]|nr:hypothetical protein CPB86DRAFT_813355 [Serendipita vermifera]
MNHGQVRYGNAYSPYPYGNPSNNVSTTSVSSLASTSSKIFSIFKSKEKPPPVPEKDYPYGAGRNALPSSSSLSLSMTLSDAGTTASGHSDSTSGTRKRAKELFKIGKRSKKDRSRDQVAHEISSPRNVKHEIHIGDELSGFPPEWHASLAALGFSQEEIQHMMEQKRQGSSRTNTNLVPLGSLAAQNAAGISTAASSSSGPYRYPSPPAQYAVPGLPQVQGVGSLILQTEFNSSDGDHARRQHPNMNSPGGFASLRSIPDRTASPVNSVRSKRYSQSGSSESRASPVPSLNRDYTQAPSGLSKVVASSGIQQDSTINSVSAPTTRGNPVRPAPPPPLFSESSISIRQANAYKPPTAIAVQGSDSDDDDDAALATLTSSKTTGLKPPNPSQLAPSQVSTNDQADTPTTASLTGSSQPSSTDSVAQPTNASTSSSSTATPVSLEAPPRLTLGDVPRISLSFGGLGDNGNRQSVDWSESLFSALPSATAFSGFRTSVVRPPGSGKSSPLSVSTTTNNVPTSQSNRGQSTGPTTSQLASKDAEPEGQSPRPSPSSSSRQNSLSNALAFGESKGSNSLPSVSPAPPSLTATARSENPRLKASLNADGEERTSTYHLSSFLDDDQDHRISTMSVDYPDSQERRLRVVNDRTSLASRGSIASSDVLGSDRLTRASMSSYGGYDDDEPEAVVVSRATAVKIARAPSIALQRNFDILTQANAIGAANLDDDQIASAHWRAATSNPGARGFATGAAQQGYLHPTFEEEEEEEEDSDEDHHSEEEEDDEEDDEDPNSRYTIRLDDVKAKQLMDAVMKSGGELDPQSLNSLALKSIAEEKTSSKERPTSTGTISAKDAAATGRPLSSATIQTLRAPHEGDSRPHQLTDKGDSDHEDELDRAEDDEGTSALDDWLEANESEDEGLDLPDEEELNPPTGGQDSGRKSQTSDGSEYDDTDYPLNASNTKSFDINGNQFMMKPPLLPELSPTSPIYSVDSSHKESEQGAADQEAMRVSSIQFNPIRMSDTIPDTPFVLAPGQMSVSTHGHSRETSKSSEKSFRTQRGSMIHVPTANQLAALKLAQTKGEKMSDIEEQVVEERAKSPPARQPVSPNALDKKSREILFPVLQFLQPDDPNFLFSEFHQVAEGESGGVYAARLVQALVRNPPGDGFVAVKKISLVEQNRLRIETLHRELTLFERVKHENILSYSGLWLSPEGPNDQELNDGELPRPELWLRMELMERSLADLLGLYGEGLIVEERHVARFARDVASALAHLEKLFIAHRDVRSDNLLVRADDGLVKLADFASAVQLSAKDTFRTDEAGVIYWQAPEMRKRQRQRQPDTPSSDYGFLTPSSATSGGIIPYDAMKVDVWSLGATVWELIEGKTPFENEHHTPVSDSSRGSLSPGTMALMEDRLPELTKVQDVSQGLLGFLSLCEMPPERRPSAKTLLDMPFIRSACPRAEVVELLSQAREIEQMFS